MKQLARFVMLGSRGQKRIRDRGSGKLSLQGKFRSW